MSNFDNLADKVSRLELQLKQTQHLLQMLNTSYLGKLVDDHPLTDPRQEAIRLVTKFHDWQANEIEKEELQQKLRGHMAPLARA